jgi:ATP-dependent Clp protease adaptor protein ClpS
MVGRQDGCTVRMIVQQGFHEADVEAGGVLAVLMPLRASGDESAGGGGDDSDRDDNTGVATRTRPKVKKPSRYKVLILNDDYTPMEFVVFVLERLFNKSRAEATRIMLHIHNHGVGLCGVFSYEVAETKVAQVLDLARRNEHPLQCTLEKEE